jgi:hypothetical protein
MGSTAQVNYGAAGYELSLLLNDSQGGNSQTIIDQITTDINSNFNNSFTGAETSSDGVVTYGRMIGRNMTLSKVAGDLNDSNVAMENETKKKRDTYTRQGEINEWQAQNKLDTLFFLQILFIFLGITIVLIFLRQAGIIGSGAMYMIVGILVVVVIGVLWNRVSYTEKSRDKRYWNRRYIGLDDSNLSASQCSP